MLKKRAIRLYSGAQISGKTMPWLSDSSQAHRLFHDREIRCVLRGIYSELNRFGGFYSNLLFLNRNQDKKVVHPAGLEPTTYCSGGSRSIQMSYGCTSKTTTTQNGARHKNNAAPATEHGAGGPRKTSATVWFSL